MTSICGTLIQESYQFLLDTLQRKVERGSDQTTHTTLVRSLKKEFNLEGRNSYIPSRLIQALVDNGYLRIWSERPRKGPIYRINLMKFRKKQFPTLGQIMS